MKLDDELVQAGPTVLLAPSTKLTGVHCKFQSAICPDKNGRNEKST